MKIAVWHNYPSGGGKRALYDHVRGLVARGHTVDAWCPSMADLAYLPLTPMAREHVVDLAWPLPAGRLNKLGVKLHIKGMLSAMDAHCRECASQIERGGYDILFANSCFLTGASPIGRYVSMPSVLYLQEPYRHLYEAKPRLHWLAPPDRATSLLDPKTYKAILIDQRDNRSARLQAREEVDNAAAFTRILVNSYFSRESILRVYGLDCDVCYLGVDTVKFTDENLPREGFVIGLSAIQRHKNVQFCIRALATVPEPRPDLMWIGNVVDEDYLREMQDLATSLGVRFVPHVKVADDMLVDMLNRALAMVYAPRLEPFGLAPLEANACGVPVVAVAEGGVRETIVDGENGFLVPAEPEAMGAAIARLQNDPGLARRLGGNARALVQRQWSFEASTDRIERTLQRYANASGETDALASLDQHPAHLFGERVVEHLERHQPE